MKISKDTDTPTLKRTGEGESLWSLGCVSQIIQAVAQILIISIKRIEFRISPTSLCFLLSANKKFRDMETPSF